MANANKAPYNPMAAERARMSSAEILEAVNAMIDRDAVVLPDDPALRKAMIAKLTLLVLHERYQQELKLETDD